MERAFRSNSLLLCVTMLVLPLSGCGTHGCTSIHEWIDKDFKVGPDVCVPGGPAAGSWIDENDARIQNGLLNVDQWWTQFNDPVLNMLIAQATSQNLSLREAGFRVMAARARLAISKGNLFPQEQDVSGGIQRMAQSLKSNSSAGFSEHFFNQYGVGFNATWEADFWGRFRRTIKAAEHDVNAEAASYGFVMITLQADVAANYITFRTLQKRIEYLQQNVDLQRQNMETATDRFRHGRTGPLDVHQAESQLASTDARLPELQIELRQTANRLCVLLGIPLTHLESSLGIAQIPVAPESVGPGFPAQLLMRRPDVQEAVHRAYEQGERIGIAEADLYPRLGITGTIGFQSQSPQELFTSDALMGNIGPGFEWKILNYGRLRNNVRQQKARFQELVLAYQQTVLIANAEVEDGLVAFIRYHEQADRLDQSVTATQKSAAIVQKAYQSGADRLDGRPFDFNRLTTIQQDLVEQLDLQAQAHGNVALSLVEIYRALGGGWQCGPLMTDGPKRHHHRVFGFLHKDGRHD